jgi:lysophospholipase L1-like esterase
MTVDHPIFTGRELELYLPRTIIIQIGIVDCAPRKLSRREKEFVTAIPVDLLSRAVNHVMTRARARSRRRAYVPKDRYQENLKGFLKRASDDSVENVVIVKILTAGDNYTQKNPTVGEAIRDYNAVIDDIDDTFEFVTALRPLSDDGEAEREVVDEHTIDDGYHLNRKGHERLFERLRAVL